MACAFIKKPVNVNFLNFLLHRPYAVLQMQFCNYSENVKPIDSSSPVEVLKRKISKGELMDDEHQLKVMQQLEIVYQNLKGYEPPEKESFLTKWISNGNKKKKAPKGLYLYGAVGGGKTMMMDLFYNCCQVSPYSILTVLQIGIN